MADSSPHTTTADFATPIRSDDFEHRWAAWQARGVAHEHRVRRRMAVALPILLIGAALLLWLFSR